MRKIIFSPTPLAKLSLFKSGNQKLVFKIIELINDIQKILFRVWANLNLSSETTRAIGQEGLMMNIG